MADTPQSLEAYGAGLLRGSELGHDQFKRKVLRLLRTRHAAAMKFAAEGDMTGTPSVYFEARADLLALLVREVGEL